MTAREKIATLVRALDEALADLETYAGDVPRERFETDRNSFRMVCHALYTAAQAAIDIAEVILAEEGLGPAASYRDAFGLLARAGLLPAAVARELAGWAGLRNVLAHVYTRLDLTLLHAAYTGDLAALRALRQVALTRAGKSQGPAP